MEIEKGYPMMQIRRSTFLLASSLLLLFYSCDPADKDDAVSEICGLASPVFFTSDSLKLDLNDYFANPDNITSVEFPEGLIISEAEGGHTYFLRRTAELPLLSVIELETSTGGRYAILIKNLKSVKSVISFNPGNINYSDVKVRGSLNRWNVKLSNMHKVEDGYWEEEFTLPPGEYQYLIVADGREIRDPANTDSIDNNMGGFNSVLKVGNYQQKSLPFISTTQSNKGKVVLESTALLDEVIALWQNRRAHVASNRGSISVEIPNIARNLKRSYLRIIGYNETGISNDVLIPLENGKVVKDPSQLSRYDRQTMILYFMMIDRFNDGNPRNNKPVADPEILPQANYFGGDMQGIDNKLNEGYFDSLGINSIWLSPITQNPLTAYGLYLKPHTRFSGYHGYWPVSSTKIDFRLGDSITFKQLIGDAHERNINVLLDYVASHIHELHPVYRLHPDWVTPLYLPDGTMNTERWDEYRLTTWFDTFLPKLDLSNPVVADAMSDSALFWLSGYGIDGFRHDATKHIDELFWRILTKKIKIASHCNPMPYQIGETYGSPELISSYIGSGMLDAQFDFNVYDDEVAVFARENESFDRLKTSLTQSLRYYGYHNLMGYISGNQDRPRFISLAGGALRFNEDSKLAGWTRKIDVGDSTAYRKLMLLQAFNLTIPGIPTIYYGDEIGLPGANDPDNRRWMKFEGLTQDERGVKKFVSTLTHERSINMTLLYGDLQFLPSGPNTMVYIRTYFNDFTIMVFNKGNKSEVIKIKHPLLENKEIKSLFGSELETGSEEVTVQLPPYSFEMIITK
jgi:cyclomaltodextrinase / maltogenic alpha-amylase / neopullulanase